MAAQKGIGPSLDLHQSLDFLGHKEVPQDPINQRYYLSWFRIEEFRRRATLPA